MCHRRNIVYRVLNEIPQQQKVSKYEQQQNHPLIHTDFGPLIYTKKGDFHINYFLLENQLINTLSFFLVTETRPHTMAVNEH